jgi:hypothetical protein
LYRVIVTKFTKLANMGKTVLFQDFFRHSKYAMTISKQTTNFAEFHESIIFSSKHISCQPISFHLLPSACYVVVVPGGVSNFDKSLERLFEPVGYGG